MRTSFTYFLGVMLVLFSAPSTAKECKSCQEHRNGGSISYGGNYAPGGVYQPGGQYYPGGVYPGYNNGYYGNYQNRGSFTQTCGYGSVRGDHNLSGNGCVTQYRGPASDINQLPRINRQIHQTQPHKLSSPWQRPQTRH